MTEIIIGGIHKWEIRHIDENIYDITFFEKMGNRWVKFDTNTCNKAFIIEEFELTEEEFNNMIY